MQFIQINPFISNRHLAQHLLTKPEIIRVFELGGDVNTKRKQELVNLLEETPIRAFNRLTFQVIQLVNEDILDVLQVLFFANTYQNLSQFVLQDLGWRVYYAENSFLNGLFGLAFWPAIFAPIDGAFINAFQRMPKDMFSPLFIEKRRSIIDSNFNELKTHGLSCLMATFNEKQGIENPFVYWPTMTKSLLEQAISIIPLKHVMVLFEILLSDLRNMKTGMPDLIAFKENEYWWVEVKGPGDKLQYNQKRWLHHFNQHRIPYSVCYVNHNK